MRKRIFPLNRATHVLQAAVNLNMLGAFIFFPLPLQRDSAGFYAAPPGQGRNQTRIPKHSTGQVLTRVVLGCENYRDLKPRSQHFFRWVAVNLPVWSCTRLAFSTGDRSRNCCCRTRMRRFLGSSLVVVGESPKLGGDRSVGHGLDSAEQALCYLSVFPASL